MLVMPTSLVGSRSLQQAREGSMMQDCDQQLHFWLHSPASNQSLININHAWRRHWLLGFFLWYDLTEMLWLKWQAPPLSLYSGFQMLELHHCQKETHFSSGKSVVFWIWVGENGKVSPCGRFFQGSVSYRYNKYLLQWTVQGYMAFSTGSRKTTTHNL